MKKVNGSIKRISALLLCVLMIVTYMPMNMIAYAEDTVSGDAIDERSFEEIDEETAEGTGEGSQEDVVPDAGEPPADDQSEPAAEDAAEPEAEEPAAETENESEGTDIAPAAEGVGSESAETGDAAEGEPAAETSDETGESEAAEPGESEEPADPEDQGEAEQPADDETGETEEEQEDDPIEVTHPAQTFSASEGGVMVAVTAPVGALPAGSNIVVLPVDEAEIADKIAGAVGGDVAKIKAVDISFVDANGDPVQPSIPVIVYMGAGEIKTAQKEIVHIDDDGVATTVDYTDVASTGLAKFETTDFSIYANVELAAAPEAKGEGDGETGEEEPIETWTVTFYDRDAELHTTVEVVRGEEIGDKLPAVIEREDYDAFWAIGEIVPDTGGQGYVINVTGDRIDETFVPEANTTVVPDYELINYTVKFYTDESLAVQVGEPKTVNADSNYCVNDIPAVPTREGYSSKWVYQGAEGVEDFTNNVAITQDTNVWVQYEKNVFTVTFMVNGEIYQTDDYYTGASLRLPSEPTSEGQDFDGWFSGDTEYVGGEQVTSDLTLTARFKDVFSVAFIVTHDDGTEERLTQYFRTSGQTVGVIPQTPFIAGKVFEKWVERGTDNVVTAETVVDRSIIADAVFRTITVYDIEAIYYYLNDRNEEVVFNTDLLEAETHELPYTITAPATTQTDPDEVSGAPIYYPETPVVTLEEDDFDEDHKVTVRFQYVPYTATYDFVYYLKNLDGNGYTEIERTSDVQGVLNSYVTPTVKNYNYAVLELAEGATITQAEGQELNVYYNRKDFQLSYETNGGTYVAGATVPYGTVVDLPSDDPTRQGYTFAGWYSDSDLTQQVTGSVTVNEDTTLYAKWNGDTVNYSVIIMKEKYDNATGQTSYVYENSMTRSGTVGTTVYAASVTGVTVPNGYEKLSSVNGTPTAGGTGESTAVEIKADGSAVLKVYLSLIRYTLVFNANQGTIDIDGRTYTGSNYRVENVVLGQEIGSRWPSSSTEIYRSGRYFNGWTGGPSTYITKQYELVWNHVQNANTTSHVMTYTASWANSSSDRDAYYWLQQPDGTWAIEDAYTQIGLNTTNLGAKEIDGYTKHNGDASRPNNTYPASGNRITSITQNNNGGYVQDDNRSGGNGYTYYEYGGHLYRERDTSWWGNIDTGKTRYNVTFKYAYNFYYDRAQYKIDYYYESDLLTTKSNIFFEANINTAEYNYTPARPEGIDADYEWGGWYDNAGLQDPAYTFDKMPGNNLVLYAKWIAPEYTVSFVDGENTSTHLFDDQTVEKYHKATNPGTPTKTGYTFNGWFTTADGTTLFDWNTQITKDTTVYAHWTRNTLTYTVHYVDEEGQTLAADKTVSNPNYVVDQVITEQAIAIAGYRPNENSKTLTLAETGNEITFVYSAKAETTGYTVRYILDPAEYPGDIKVAEEKVVTGVPGSTASIIELAEAVDYTALYAAHPELQDIEFFPDEVEKTLVLTASAETNVFTFIYSSYANAKVTVHFVDMAGNPIASDDVQTLKVSKTFTLSRTPIAGWELNKAVVGTSYDGSAAGTDYKITEAIAQNGLEFTLFYQKKATVTVINKSKQYDGTPLKLTEGISNQVRVDGILDGDELSSLTYEYNGNDVEAGRLNAGIATVTPGNAVITGTHGNTNNYYSVRYISGTLEVTKINVTIRVEPDRWTGITYDGTEKKTGFTNGSKSLEDYVIISHDGYKDEYLDDVWAAITALDNVIYDASAAGLGYYVEAEKDADDYTYYVGLTKDMLPENDNYSVNLYVRPGRLEIRPKAVTITTASDEKVYDGIPLTKTDGYTVEGIVEGETYGFEVTGSRTEVGTSRNTYEITWAGDNTYTAKASNYTVTENLGTLMVTNAALTIAVKTRTTTYNGEPQYGFDAPAEIIGTGETIETDEYKIEGLIAGQTLTITGYTPSTGTNAGTYANGSFDGATITITAGEDDVTEFYTIEKNAGDLKIEPKAVTVKADAKTKVYGESDPALTATVTGTLDGDTVTYELSRAEGEDVGEYTITPTGSETQGNYKVTYETGTLTITPKEVTITVDDKSKVYGDPDPTFTGTVTGLVNDDDLGTITYSRTNNVENVGNYPDVLDASYTPNDNYTVTVVKGDFEITKATVTVTAVDKTKVYGDADPQLTATVTGLKRGDAESVISYTISREEGEDVGTYTITAAGDAVQGNYDVVYVPGTFTITKATVTVKAENKTKVYGDTDPALTATVTGLKNGDAESVITYTLNRASGEDVGTYTITPAGEAVQGNYDVVYETGTLTITKAKVTVTADNKTKVYGDTDPALTATVSGLKNGDAESLISYTLTRAPGENVGEYTITPSGDAVQGNYDVEYVTGTLTITKAKVTVTADNKTKVYGEADPALTATVTGLRGSDTESVISYTLSRVEGEDVGTYTITPSGDAAQGNYDVEYKTGTLTITKATVTVTADNKEKVYGAEDPELTATVTGLKNGDAESVISYTLGREEGEDVGSYVITAAGDAEQGNYDVVYVPGTFVITKAKVIVTAENKTKVYGDADPELTATVSGLQNGDDASVISYTLSREEGEDVGTYTITPSGEAVQGNYEVEYKTGTLTITKAKVVITADNKTKVYGDADPELTWTADGLKNGDTKDVLTVSISREPGENVGQYTITPSGEEVQGNYEVEYVTGTLAITKAKVTVTADNKTKVYGETDPQLTATVTGLKNNDAESVIRYTLSRVEGEDVGQYTITPSGDAEQGNYDVEYVPGKLTITKATVTVTAEDKTKVYGTADPELTWTVDGLQFEDTKDVLTVTIGREAGENVGQYAITPAGEAEQGNYNVVYVPGTFTITKAKVTVTADDKTKVYGDTDPEFTATVTGLVGTDTIEYTLNRTAGENVGKYTITPTGEAEQGNYDVEYVTGTLTITKAQVTVTAEDKTKVYGDADPELTWTADGLKNGDTKDVLTVAISREPGENVGEYTITPSGAAEQGNYDVVYATGTLTITKATVTVTADDKTKTYGEADPELTATVTGLKGSDDESVITYTLSRAEGEDVGQYTITPAGDAVQGNYNVEYETGTLTIEKRKITVTATGGTKEYDGTPITAEATGYTISSGTLASGDAETVTLTGERTLVGTETAVVAGVVIKNGENDVTSNYDITKVNGTLKVTDRTEKYEITVVANSDEVKYDGAEHTASGFETLIFTVNGQTYTVSGLTASVTKTDAGTYTNEITGTAVVKDAAGNDVTAQFIVNKTNGELVINKRTVTLTSATDQKEYDGTPLTNSTVTVSGDGFVAGEGATYDVTGSQTIAGSSANAFTYTLNEGTKADNYTINTVNGTLTVTDRTTKYEITVESNSAEETYDGTEKTAEGFKTLTFTENGQTYTVEDLTASVTETDAGTYTNAITGTAVVKDAAGNDVTAQFTVKQVEGQLVINKRTVTLTSATDEKEYDGTPLTNHTVTVGGAGFAEGEGATYDVTGTRTLVGSSENTFTYTLNANTKADNYTITTSNGTLTVKNRDAKYEIEVESNSDTVKYDGEEHTASGFKTLTFEVEGNTYTVEGLTASVTKTDAGTYANAISGTPVVKDAAGNDVTAQFAVSTKTGQLVINKRTVTLTSADGEKEYDGTPLVKNAQTDVTVGGDGFAEGEGAVYNITGTRTLVGSDPNTFTYTLNANTKAENYTIETVFGTLTVKDRAAKYEVEITANSYEGIYDGASHTAEGFVDETANGVPVTADGKTYYVTGVTSTATGTNVTESVASIPVTGTVVVKDADGNDVTAQFNVTINKGHLTITKKAVTLTSGNAEKEYDGTALTNADVEGKNANGLVVETGWVGNEGATYSFTGRQTLIGDSANAFTYTLKEGTLAENYDIAKTEGRLVVTSSSKVLTIVSADDSKKYDGTELHKAEYTVTYGGTAVRANADGTFTLPTGDTLTITDTSKVKDVKDTAEGNNTFTYDLENEGQYATVTPTYGTLTITKRAVTLTSADDSKEYDGTALTNSTVTVSGDGFVTGEGYTANVTGTITNVGTAANAFTYTLTGGATEGETGNYTITKEEGTLEITQSSKVLTIVSADDSKKYDGTELHKAEYTVTYGGTEVEANEDGTFTLPTGDKLTITDTSKVKDVKDTAEGNNTFTYVLANAAQYKTVTTTSGTLTITKREVTLTSADDNKEYDGMPLTNSTVTVSGDGFVTGEGYTANVTGTITNVGTAANAFTYTLTGGATEGETGNYTITKIEGTLEITQSTKVLTIVSADAEKKYDGTELHKAEYTVTYGGTEVEANEDGTFTLPTGDKLTITDTSKVKDVKDTAEGNNTFTYVLANADQYKTVTPTYGTLTITPREVTLTSADDKKPYDGKPLTNSTVTVSGDEFVTGEGFTADVTGTITNVGTEPNAFTYTLTGGATEGEDGNYIITKEVGTLEITPIDVTVKIIGHNSTDPYDGKAHTVTGYDAECEDLLYDVTKDFTFAGSAIATRTNVVEGQDADGQTDMGLTADQFTNNNPNFGTVTFVVTDGYQKITPISVTVTIVGKHSTDTFDGKEHTVEGYTATASSDLFDVENDIAFEGTATASRTYVVEGDDTDGQTDMGLTADQFTCTDPNFTDVTFDITDGYQKITPVDEVVVTIVGHFDTSEYDGEEHVVRGYDVETSNPLYTENDFTFSGDATASRTNVVEGEDADGRTDMGLAADQFTNTNPNFAKVTFDVTDGYQKIVPIDVTVKIVGNSSTDPYDGKKHTVEDYTATCANELYDVTKDFTFSGDATASRTNVVEGEDADGQTDMGLAADQFTNINPNFATVTFDVTDGYQKITPIDVTVRIVGNNNSNVYDGKAHTTTGYVATCENELYDVENGFTFSGDATATRTHVVEGEDADGITDMGLAADQFTNIDPNFATVTFEVTDGYQEITKATMTIEAVDYEGVYDGESHEGGVTGDIPEGSTVEYSTDGGETWTTEPPSITDVGEEDYIVKITNPDYEDAEDEGTLTVTPKHVTVTADPKSKVYKEADPELTATEEGVLEGESLEYSLYRDPGEDVGSYNISFEYAADETEPAPGFFGWLRRVFTPKTDTVLMGNYEVEFIDGEFDITARALTITASSATKTYDGTALTSESYTAATLAEGDTIQSVTIKGSQTEVGTSANVASAAKIVDENGNDVTGNYEIKYIDGTLTVTAAPLPPDDGDGPKTGDNGAGNYPYMMIGSAAGILAMVLGKKRRDMARRSK